MICINCFHAKTTVANSRRHKKQPSVWRRRHCPACKTAFTTYERASLDGRLIIGADNELLPFNIGKLTISIAESFRHDKKSADSHSFALAETIETKLLLIDKDLTSIDIASVTHATLKLFDPIAALQYAARHDLIRPNRQPGRPSTSYR